MSFHDPRFTLSQRTELVLYLTGSSPDENAEWRRLDVGEAHWIRGTLIDEAHSRQVMTR